MKLSDILNQEILLEMPKTIDDIKWHDLFDDDKNKSYYDEIRIQKHKKLYLKLNDHANIYQYKTEFICLDTEIKRVTYFMKYQVGNNGILGNYVWQSLVWKDFNSSYLNGIPQKIFEQYLIHKFGCVITDSEQSWDGERFWNLRIADAWDNKLFVYYYNFQTRELIPVMNREDFRNIKKDHDIWGPSDKHKMKRMVISQTELPI